MQADTVEGIGSDVTRPRCEVLSGVPFLHLTTGQGMLLQSCLSSYYVTSVCLCCILVSYCSLLSLTCLTQCSTVNDLSVVHFPCLRPTHALQLSFCVSREDSSKAVAT